MDAVGRQRGEIDRQRGGRYRHQQRIDHAAQGGNTQAALLQVEVMQVFQQIAAEPEADAGLDLVGGPRAVDEHQVEGQQAEDAQEHHHNGADDLGAPNGGGIVVLHRASPPA